PKKPDLPTITDAPTEPRAPQGPKLSGYAFRRKLGAGASGEVYEGLHEALDRPVAIKVIKLAAKDRALVRTRFLREARLAASLVHPGIVQVLDARDEGEFLYLVMELVEGESVKARIDRQGPLGEAAVLGIAVEALAALEAAHARGVVHR